MVGFFGTYMNAQKGLEEYTLKIDDSYFLVVGLSMRGSDVFSLPCIFHKYNFIISHNIDYKTMAFAKA